MNSVYDTHQFFMIGTHSKISCQSCIAQYEKDEGINPDEISIHTHWEGEDLTCDGCNTPITSCYGVPE